MTTEELSPEFARWPRQRQAAFDAGLLERITLTLDRETVSWFKGRAGEDGPIWMMLADHALKHHAERAQELQSQKGGITVEPEDHVQTARHLMARADQEMADAGNLRIASELQWGAFIQCIIAKGETLRMPGKSHEDFEDVARHLDSITGDHTWRRRYAEAEKLHHNFLHGSLTDRDAQAIILKTREATLELLTTL